MLFDTRYFWTLFTSKDSTTTASLKRIYDRSETPCVSAITIFEIVKLSLGAEGKDVAELRARTIEGEFEVIGVDSSIAQEGAVLSHRLRVPMADGLIMATAKVLRVPCVTDDPHFSDVKKVWI